MYRKKLINLHRTDSEYRAREDAMKTERTKRTMMIGALGLGVIGVMGSLALKTAGLFSGRKMF